jgi:hypothetical protein
LEDLDRNFDKYCDVIKAEKFHLARSDFLREWRFLKIIWNRLQEDYRIFNESRSQIKDGTAENFKHNVRIGRMLMHSLECIHLDTNCFIMNARILMDGIAYLTTFFWHKIARRQPEWKSFKGHKDWFRSPDKRSEILDEDYAGYITQHTDWFENELKDIRDKLVVHRRGSYVDMFTENTEMVMLGKAEFKDKDGETFVEYDMKQIPDLNKLMDNVCGFLDFFDRHFSEKLASSARERMQ